MHKTRVWLPAMAALATRVFWQQDWLFALQREACFGNRIDSLLSSARKPRSRTAENDRPGGACSGNWSGGPDDYGGCRFPELPAPGRRTPRSPLLRLILGKTSCGNWHSKGSAVPLNFGKLILISNKTGIGSLTLSSAA